MCIWYGTTIIRFPVFCCRGNEFGFQGVLFCHAKAQLWTLRMRSFFCMGSTLMWIRIAHVATFAWVGFRTLFFFLFSGDWKMAVGVRLIFEWLFGSSAIETHLNTCLSRHDCLPHGWYYGCTLSNAGVWTHCSCAPTAATVKASTGHPKEGAAAHTQRRFPTDAFCASASGWET